MKGGKNEALTHAAGLGKVPNLWEIPRQLRILNRDQTVPDKKQTMSAHPAPAHEGAGRANSDQRAGDSEKAVAITN